MIIEVKAVRSMPPYSQHNCSPISDSVIGLRLSDRRLGLIINFAERLVKDGIHRVANNL